MTNQNLPSIEYLHKRLRFDAETGKLFWRECQDMSKQWNGRYADKEALAAPSNGYKRGHIDGTLLLAHRAVWAIAYGSWPNGQVDHINGNRSDNHLSNLRDVMQSENQRNAMKRSDNTSGVCGVVWHKRVKKWQAQMRAKNKNIHLGYFTTIEEAATARAAASKEHGYTERHGT